MLTNSRMNKMNVESMETPQKFGCVVLFDILKRNYKYVSNPKDYKRLTQEFKAALELVAGVADEKSKVPYFYNQQSKLYFDADIKKEEDEYFNQLDFCQDVVQKINKMFPSEKELEILFMKRPMRVLKDGKVKYSYHIVVNNIRITPANIQKIIIQHGYNEKQGDGTFDISVYGSNYGLYSIYTSTKYDMSTKEYVDVGQLVPFNYLTGEELTDINIFDYCPSYIEEEFEDYDAKYAPIVKPKGKELKKPDIISILSSKSDIITEDELKFLRGLVGCLEQERAEDYKMWIELGWALYNISDNEKCLEIWEEFSQLGSSYKAGECSTLWSKMEKKGMTIGTLKYWAKLDNVAKYNDVVSNNIMPLLDLAVSNGGTHYDVAKFIAKYKEGEIVYDKKTYFVVNNNNIWKQQDDKFISKLCGEEIARKFFERAYHWGNLSFSIEDPAMKPVYEERQKKALKIKEQLGNSGYVDSLKKQLPALFQFDSFLETKLDENIHLFAFNNCVFDTDTGMIRKIEPNDYISITTGYDYDEKVKEEDIGKIRDLFNMYFNTDEMRDYVLSTLASLLFGKNIEQSFYVWTGTGSNGKSFLQQFVANVMGGYASKVNATTFTKASKGQNENTEMYDAKGKRFVYCEEPENEDNNKLIASRLKEFSGDTRLKTKGLFRDPVEWWPQFRVFMGCNDIPQVSSTDGGVKRRIKIIDFPNKFCENPRGMINLDGSIYYEYPENIELKYMNTNPIYIKAFAELLIRYYKTNLNRNTKIKVPKQVELRNSEYVDGCNNVLTFVNSTFIWKVQDYTENDKMMKAEGTLKIDDISPYHRNYKYEYRNSKVLTLPQFADELKKIGIIVKNNQGKYKAHYIREMTDEDRERLAGE